MREELNRYRTVSSRSSDEAAIAKSVAASTASYEAAMTKLTSETETLKTRVYGMENSLKALEDALRSMSSKNAASAEQNIGVDKKLMELSRKMTTLESDVHAMDKNAQFEQLKKFLGQLSTEVMQLKKDVSNQQDAIHALKRSIEKPDVSTASVTRTVPVPAAPHVEPKKSEPHTEPKTAEPDNVVKPDVQYVSGLLSRLTNIKAILERDFEKCKCKLQELLEEDDAEEIMQTVHGMIEKYIYGKHTQVSHEEWQTLEQYIVDAGYVSVPVKAGDNIAPFKQYFARAIPAEGGTANTIKMIQQKPFVLTYDDCGTKETIKLCGKCTYYK